MKTIREAIEDALMEMGIPCRLKGFSYIVDAAEILDGRLTASVTKEVYPKIARRNGVTIPRVERCIRHAIGKAYEIGDPERVEYYFRGNTTNGTALATLSLVVRRDFIEFGGHKRGKNC